MILSESVQKPLGVSERMTFERILKSTESADLHYNAVLQRGIMIPYHVMNEMSWSDDSLMKV